VPAWCSAAHAASATGTSRSTRCKAPVEPASFCVVTTQQKTASTPSTASAGICPKSITLSSIFASLAKGVGPRCTMTTL
jgi:hypothetical protein